MALRKVRENGHYGGHWIREHRRDAINTRDGGLCVYCQRKPHPVSMRRRGSRPDLDHAVPPSRGGSHACDNLLTCCVFCNASKGDQTVTEWLSARVARGTLKASAAAAILERACAQLTTPVYRRDGREYQRSEAPWGHHDKASYRRVSSSIAGIATVV